MIDFGVSRSGGHMCHTTFLVFIECAYGDKRDCTDITKDECNQGDIADACCETCRFLRENSKL